MASSSRILLPIFFSLVLLLVLESMVRTIVYLFDIELDIVVVHPNLGQAELKKQIYVNDRYLLWRMKPNLHGQFVSPALATPDRRPPTFRVITNGRGFAGTDFSDAKRKGTLRIVCLGNSSTFGWGVQPDSCYVRLLEQMLKNRIDRDVEVINAGVPGYSSMQGLVLFEREIIGLCPDVITFSFGANDCHLTSRSDADIMREREGAIGAVQEIMSHSSTYRAMRYVIVSSRMKNAAKSTESPTRHRVDPVAYRETMRHLVSSARDTGAAVFLIGIFPLSERWDPYRGALAEISDDCGIPLLETGKLFEEFLSDDARFDDTERRLAGATLDRYGEDILERHPDICLRLDMVHPTPLGHMLIAGRICDLIMGQFHPEGN